MNVKFLQCRQDNIFSNRIIANHIKKKIILILTIMVIEKLDIQVKRLKKSVK
jgi:hypothetical protein